MKAFVITMEYHKESMDAAKVCIESSKKVGNTFVPETFKAITSEKAENMMRYKNLRWDYPWDRTEIDLRSGLVKAPYQTAVPMRRIACALSHYSLWELCTQLDEPVMVLEHDALFIKKVNDDLIPDEKYGIIGINDPRGATRKSAVFYEKILRGEHPIMRVPSVDDSTVPQGLAGNSAYIIQPFAAKRLMQAVEYYGLWPNDALMCRQLFPGMLYVTRTFYTTVQRMKSTTTL